MEERRKNRAGSGERRKADAERIADQLNKLGRTSVHVRGTSLLPLVRPGDVALIRRDKLENMRSGDVVLMQRGEHLIAKRIGEDEDAVGAETPGEMIGDVSQGVFEKNAQQELLGKIVGVRRKKEKTEVAAKKNAAEASASVVLRPARWSEG